MSTRKNVTPKVGIHCNWCGLVYVDGTNDGGSNYHPKPKSDHCPKCDRLMWQAIAVRGCDGPNKLRTTSAHYRALIAGSGAEPGKKIVTCRPIPKQDLPGMIVDFRPYQPKTSPKVEQAPVEAERVAIDVPVPVSEMSTTELRVLLSSMMQEAV